MENVDFTKVTFFVRKDGEHTYMAYGRVKPIKDEDFEEWFRTSNVWLEKEIDCIARRVFWKGDKQVAAANKDEEGLWTGYVYDAEGEPVKLVTGMDPDEVCQFLESRLIDGGRFRDKESEKFWKIVEGK